MPLFYRKDFEKFFPELVQGSVATNSLKEMSFLSSIQQKTLLWLETIFFRDKTELFK